MKISLENVRKTMAAHRESFTQGAKANVRVTTARMVEALKEATPVDTGEARASWSSTPTPEGARVVNTAEHIQYLNRGSSKQAPSFFVESTALKYGTPQGAIVESGQ